MLTCINHFSNGGCVLPQPTHLRFPASTAEIILSHDASLPTQQPSRAPIMSKRARINATYSCQLH
jgi:hypothetical protein